MDKILVIDDEEYIGWVIKKSFEKTEHEVFLCQTAKDGLVKVQEENFDLVFLDLRLPDMDGMDVLIELKKIQPDIVVIIITAHGSIDTAIESMKKGAFDYLTKPFDIDELIIQADKAVELLRLKGEINYLRNEKTKEMGEYNFTSNNESLNLVYKSINQIAQASAPIFITGENGTGKEILAKRIHQESPRAKYPFMTLDCGIMTEDYMDIELFGNEKIATIGAEQKKLGILELANKGTMFLDGIDKLSLKVQGKLFKVLQDKEFKKQGINSTIKIDIRIIAATNKNLMEAIDQGKFREDLYYTLNVIPLTLPPLRERKEDIKDLVKAFIKKYDSVGKITNVTPEAMKLLKNYYWPGNLRELKNVIEKIVILSDESCIKASALTLEIQGQIKNVKDPIIYFPEEGINLEKVERDLIIKALNLSGQNQSKAAQLLGITRSALIYRMQKFMI